MRAISENERGNVCTISENVDSKEIICVQSVRISVRERQCVHNQFECQFERDNMCAISENINTRERICAQAVRMREAMCAQSVRISIRERQFRLHDQ